MYRVMWFTHHLRGGGAEKAVVSLSEYFNSHPEAGVESYILVVYDDPELHVKLRNVLVMQNRSQPGDSKAEKARCVLRQMRELRLLKEQWKIDVCVSFLPGADILNVHSGKRSAMVVSVRNVESRFTHSIWKKWYVENSYRRCNQIVTVSRMAEQDCIRFFHVDPSRVTTIYNMLPAKSGKVSASAEDAGQNRVWQNFLSFIEGRRTFLNVGRLAPEKGQRYLLQAFAGVHRQIPASCLVIAGGGPLLAELTELAEQLGIRESVLFTGNVPNPSDYMSRADVFVLSSLSEGMPNVVLEAMQAGLSVIATECGAREILAPGTDPCFQTSGEDDTEYGILVPAADAETLAESMIRLIQEEPLRQQYSSRAPERLKDFTPDRIAAQWKAVLDSCVSSSGTAD